MIVSLTLGSYRAQFTADYVTLAPSQAVTEDYVVNVPVSTKKYASLTTMLAKNVAESYYNELFLVKKQIFDAGDVYLPNVVTKYVDSICSALLKSEPQVREKIKIYVTRYNSANAFCLADGSIFVNIGLLKTLDEESELAFVLAHEIAHFEMQHSVKDFSKAIAIKKNENTNTGYYSNAFRQLRFSRESELEADSYALSLITSAGFQTSMATQALSRLKERSPGAEIDLEKTFNNNFYALDTAKLSKKLLKEIESAIKSHDQNARDSKVDDLYETHPDMDKRIASVKELERNMKPSTSKRNPAVYKFYKTTAAFEICNNNLREQDYINALINSLKLLSVYPDNNFLIGNVSKSLYWISHYKNLSNDDLKIYGDLDQNTANYYQFYSLFSRLGLKDTKQMCYAFLRSREEKTAGSETLCFYLALCTENYLGKVGALEFYRSYQNKFPQGNYISFVKNKLR